ncbi:Crp/Fnr family transcriptional regulator [Anaerotalea alkaliphila]|uniref:Crp/Fnr family transcriptional regulator n=1 Tax=Anaerotalea alkaliphila TaxID=2662126 RepID=A0A7X5HX26_9FIRM|nr:Crp/Fnr family transcriptional regulator [Anaerotalea alkaliphila]NDL68248.1 Crp/Fnr family transcriptional regulator [Anaerotalea alkaliphila]
MTQPHAPYCTTCRHKVCAKKVSLFSTLEDRQLQTVAGLIQRRSAKKGEPLLHAGDIVDRLFIVNQGSLKASIFQEDGKEQILYIIQSGESIGELSLLKKEKATYDLVALEDAELCTIPKNSFDLFLRENPDVVFSILEAAHEKIASLEKMVQAIASTDADIRLKFLIQQLMRRSGVETPEGILLQLRLTREDMANFVGVTRETISRKLSQLSREGKLAFLDGKRILVKDPGHFQPY